MLTPRRELGRTGFGATALGIGDVADRAIDAGTLVATLRRGMDAGLNVIDTAPSYEEGYSEIIVGRALRESARREQMFLIDKIDELTAPVAPQVEASLRQLELEHADAFVFHGLSSMETWRTVAGPGGGMEQLAACIQAGKARFRGISSHSPQVLIAALGSGLCDIVLFPIGAFVDSRYVDEVLPLAKTTSVGTVCFKTFGAGKLLGDTSGYNRPLATRPRGKLSSGGVDEASPTLPRLSVEECLHYTLSVDPDVALLGLSFPNEQDAAWAAWRSFRGPLSAAQMADIRQQAVAARRHKGPCWWNPNPEA